MSYDMILLICTSRLTLLNPSCNKLLQIIIHAYICGCSSVILSTSFSVANQFLAGHPSLTLLKLYANLLVPSVLPRYVKV